MTDALKTYEVSGPPSIALAIMAGHLADERTPDHFNSCCMGAAGTWLGVDRSDVIECPNGYQASAEYYRIIDRIARGEKP